MSNPNEITDKTFDLGTRPDGTQGSKKNIGAVWPEKAIAALPGLQRYESYLTPEVFQRRFLFGIPLTSPITKQTLNKDDLKDFISRASSMFELDSRVDILPVVRRYRLPFDPETYRSFIYLEVPNKPVQQVIKLAIASASYSQTGSQNENARYPGGAEIYTIPNEWVEMGNATRGILNVNPINPAFTAIGVSNAMAASGATIAQFIGQQRWVPAYWELTAVIGIGSLEGDVPVLINEAIGLQAVSIIMENLIPQYRFASQSLNIDGQGQSVSDQLYALLQQKKKDAEEKYNHIVQKIKALTSTKVFSSNV